MTETRGATFRRLQGRGLVLPGNDIDTDRIIPARFLRSITFAGLGDQVFRDERFDSDGTKRRHPFNDERFRGAEILVVNNNFGCGSSREHAPQALHRFGIKAIIGVSFAEIFAGNCTSIGLVTATLEEPEVVEVQRRIEEDPTVVLTIDLETLTLSFAGKTVPLTMNPAARSALLEGTWDTLEQLLRNEDKIDQVHHRLPAFSTLT